MEEWKQVIGYEGVYDISNLGNVKRIKSYLNTRNGRILKPRKNKQGYLYVVLCDKNTTKTFKIHRLVAISFLKNPLCKSSEWDKNLQPSSKFRVGYCAGKYITFYKCIRKWCQRRKE